MNSKKFTRKICLVLLYAAVTTTNLLGTITSGNAQTPALRIVARDIANTTTTDLQVWPGRSSVIDFSQTGEIITYIRLADPSRVVFTTDAELESNQAQTIFVQPIQPLEFPGATTTEMTNLFIRTRSREGIERLYTFNIIHSSEPPTNSGISISTVPSGQEQNILTAGNTSATLNDIERGLQIAIREGYTRANDPVVFKVREFLALARNGTPIDTAAETTNLLMSIIIALGELGLNEQSSWKQPSSTLTHHSSGSLIR